MRIVKNRYLNAALLLILFSGFAHLAVLVSAAVKSRSLHPLNYFAILQIGYLFPRLAGSWQSDTASVIFVLLIYVIILKISGRGAVR